MLLVVYFFFFLAIFSIFTSFNLKSYSVLNRSYKYYKFIDLVGITFIDYSITSKVDYKQIYSRQKPKVKIIFSRFTLLRYKFYKSITRTLTFSNKYKGSRLRGLKDYKTSIEAIESIIISLIRLLEKASIYKIGTYLNYKILLSKVANI
ncbi:hypothetical protein P153DRAFT_354953 [Dothidotthia symphoricarpi CBS 119687]|uniref:Uncharacterized protein n=1 Tax=Dothidotthia symphoricarpi CBS 119687 TaxID=1392245 RepID=A0A6A6AL92_9PLEO|nr:uncharacterized protein P153DRAFT_354953 [Dothidotthia symphoricarpi CBS 119687]KAF2132336.1 hypothetical protein P153DRAFT_354953 [Dothidotthia symphoricarpi CBS 119687]